MTLEPLKVTPVLVFFKELDHLEGPRCVVHHGMATGHAAADRLSSSNSRGDPWRNENAAANIDDDVSNSC